MVRDLISSILLGSVPKSFILRYSSAIVAFKSAASFLRLSIFASALLSKALAFKIFLRALRSVSKPVKPLAPVISV